MFMPLPLRVYGTAPSFRITFYRLKNSQKWFGFTKKIFQPCWEEKRMKKAVKAARGAERGL
jgi:hypothetical protein